MLEAPHPPTEAKHNTEHTSQTIKGLDLGRKPLSPIPSRTECSRPFSADTQPRQEQEEKVEKKRSTTKAWEENTQPTEAEQADGGAAFFMTQVC